MLSTSLAILTLVVLALPIGTPVRGTLAAGGELRYTVDLPADRFVSGLIDQGESDLVVRIVAPDGEAIGVIDARDRGEDVIAFVTRGSGTHQLVVTRAEKTGSAARFTLRIHAPAPRSAEGDRVVEAVVLSSEGRSLIRKGGRELLLQAADRLTRAREIWRERAMAVAELAATIGLGNALYALSDYSKAEPVYRDALSACTAAGDARSCAEVKNNLGMVCWRLGTIPEALALLHDAIGMWRKLGSQYGEAGAQSNRGLLLQQVGQYDEARRHFERALVLIRAAGDRRGEAFVRNNIGAALDQLGQSQAGLRSIRRAVVLFRETGDRLAEGRALLFQSHIQLRLGAHPAALADARTALDLIRQASSRAAEADALLQLGRLLAPDGAPEAAEHFEAALELYRAIDSRRGVSDVQHAMGAAALAAGQPELAIESFAQALALRREIGLRRLEADTLAQLGRAELARGDLDRARTRMEEALTIVDTLHAGLFDTQLRTAYLGSNRGYHATYLQALVELHRRRPADGFGAMAFTASERYRARALIESMATRWAAAARAGSPALRQRERELREQINHWSWQLWQQAAAPASASRDTQLRTTIDGLLAEYAANESEINRSRQGIGSLLRSDAIELDTLQREILDGDTQLVEFVLTDTHAYAFAITDRDLAIVDLPSKAVIETRAIAFRRLLEVEPAADTLARRQRAAAELGRMLLTPLAPELKRRRIVIVPDGALHYVPFSALIDPRSKRPLIYSNELVSVPSSTTLAIVKREASRRTPAPRILAVVADPVMDRADIRVEASSAPAPSASLERRLSRLPYSREEAESILAFVPEGQTLRALDFDANRRIVTSGALKPFKIAHLAVHGQQDDRHPELAGLVFSLVQKSGAAQDGFLRLQDFHTLALDAELVVLSACDSGRVPSSTNGGEGLASLARGLFAARVPSVVSAAFKVSDEATAELMRLFYAGMFRDRLRPATALRSAQIALSKGRFSDPVYWSGFTLQGAW